MADPPAAAQPGHDGRAELHVHLYGAIPPATLRELARRNRVTLPATTPEGLREWLRFRDFAHFQEAMHAVGACVAGVEDAELVARDFARELRSQDVRYAEVMLAPGEMERNRGMRPPQVLDALGRARAWAAAELGLELRWILELERTLPPGRERAYWADQTTEAAIAGRDAGVVALGLSGSEAGWPPEPFAPWFEPALGAGLHSVPHAGEHAGPESVWGAIRALGAERIAHGVRAIEDPALLAHLAERRIALDVCPTSNVRLGVFPSLAAHPLRRLHEAGVPVTVNSDDPTMFGVTLGQEIAALTASHGLSEAAASEIVQNGFRYGFEAGRP
ncbi:MAG TPA: adenosine deaminase [Candidatus Dormibacteraeota bacterium]|nr:adenosine deaminase [Candidatus Dormibacteraeota bacterium]